MSLVPKIKNLYKNKSNIDSKSLDFEGWLLKPGFLNIPQLYYELKISSDERTSYSLTEGLNIRNGHAVYNQWNEGSQLKSKL